MYVPWPIDFSIRRLELGIILSLGTCLMYGLWTTIPPWALAVQAKISVVIDWERIPHQMLYTYIPKYGLPANSMSLKTPILKGVDIAVVFAKRVQVKSYRQRSQQDLHIQFTVYHSSNSCWHQWSSTTYYLTLTNLCHEAIHYHWTLSSSHSSIMEASACAWFACIRERLTRPLTKNFKWVIHLKSLLQNHRSPCIPQHW